MRAPYSVFAITALAAAFIQAQPLTNGVALSYFAPENQLFYRMRYDGGGYREFQRSLDDLRRMDGAGGWRAMISEGGRITVTGRGPQGRERYVFDKGRLVRCDLPWETNSFAYAESRIPPEDAAPPFHFGSAQEKAYSGKAYDKVPKSVAQLLGGKWKSSGRLRWPFENPNENGFLYASLALLSLSLVFLRGRAPKIAGLALSFAFFIPTLMTASRGAFLALAVGLLPAAAVNWRGLVRSRWTYIAAAAVALTACAWFATHDSRLLTRGFKGKSSWSNETRLSMWKMAPPMMADAPGGWRMNAGKAYLDWYEDFDCFTAPGSLVNDHLSKMVRMSWPVRGFYVWCWSALFLGLFWCAFRNRRYAVPAGAVAASAAAAWFNPLMINHWLWIAPVASLVPALLERPWREWRIWSAVSAISLAVSGAALAAVVVLAGNTPRPYGVAVHADGPRVEVGGRNPVVWIVDDGRSLGGAFACKELRSGVAIARNAGAACAVGYVRSCADLPASGVCRLVLGGDAGDEWLRAVSSDPELRTRLPEEVVFISPPFPPSAIPPPLFECARVKYVTGEFNARYCREFDSPPAFVEIVPMMELYISGWTRYALQ